MSVVEFLAELRRLDAHIVLDGEHLRLNVPAGVLTEDHRRELQRRKAEIMEFLRCSRQLATQQRAVVPLESRGTRVPIFAVAGHNGDVFCYRALARHLGPNQPFFGLQPPGLEEGTEPCTVVEDLAGYFANQLRTFHPQGPITVAGFCAGGSVAFELARQLSASGMVVVNLILFGAPYCRSYRPWSRRIAGCTQWMRRATSHVRALITLPVSERRRYFANLVQRRPPTNEAPTDPILRRRLAVENATVAAISAYEPQTFNGHVDLMLPCASWRGSSDAPRRWGRLAATSAEYVGPDGCDGDTMLLEEHAHTFAAFVENAQARLRARAAAQ
ncbi:MAG TPA: thioesterase domain-containing protein [Rhodanobacteraceae bacterium]|nr:thioesterase domain-containing protein [Rhodanobacteraceae bacterium]